MCTPTAGPTDYGGKPGPPIHPIQEFRRRLEAAPDGAIPFLQLFNAWRHSPDVLQLLSSPRLASTAAQLLGLDPGRPGAGPGQRVRLLQDSLFVKRVGDGETHWHADLALTLTLTLTLTLPTDH